jgi:hypothetical protein
MSVNTAFLLMAQYNGRAIVPAEEVCRDYFAHLDTPKFVRKVDAGEIDLPLVRIEGSTKSARGVLLTDLASYIDARAKEARDLNDRIHGRRVRQGNDTSAVN